DLIDAALLALDIPLDDACYRPVRSEQSRHPIVKDQARRGVKRTKVSGERRLAGADGTFDQMNARQVSIPTRSIESRPYPAFASALVLTGRCRSRATERDRCLLFRQVRSR